MRKLGVWLLACLVSFGLTAQPAAQKDGSTLTGKVIDAGTGAAVEYATVALLNPADSSVVTGGVTSLSGEFAIPAKPGTYLVRIDFISYTPLWRNGVRLAPGQKLAMGTLSLEASAKTLNEVQVVAEKSQMEFALDKRIFNVGQDLNSIGGTAADILDNIPSVTVDIDGNVELRGSGGVRILVDGRPSGLTGLSSNEALQQFPANMIERVEVITNPSARYDAEGMVGIINIILKKDRRDGLNGTFEATVGDPLSFNQTANLNYRKGKFNVFGLYGFRYRRRLGNGSTYRETFGENPTILDQDQRFTRDGISHTVRGGVEFFPDEYNTLSASAVYRYGETDNLTTIDFEEFDAATNALSGRSRRSGNEVETEPNQDYTLNWKRTFDREEEELSAVIQYSTSVEQELADIEERTLNLDGSATGLDPLLQRSRVREGQTNLLLQADYIRPIGENGRFETGYRGTTRVVDNEFEVTENQDDIWVEIEEQTNDIRYDEEIHAGYLMYGHQFGKWSAQAGVRGEWTSIRITQAEGTAEPKDYLNLFPSVATTYELNKANSFQASYSRRIRRPRFWELNPFFNFFNAQNIRAGNPDLDPEFTHAMELAYIRTGEKTTFSGSVYYRRSNGVIQWISTFEDGVTYTRPQNLATSNDWGLEGTFSYDIKEWWRVDGNANVFRSIVDGGNLGENFAAEVLSMTARLNSQFETKWFNFQLNLNYRAPRQTTQGRALAITTLDLGARKDIMDGKGTIALRVRDLFNSRRFRSEVFGDDFFQRSNWQRSVRQINLGFTYRLRKTKERGGRGGSRGGGDYDGGGDF